MRSLSLQHEKEPMPASCAGCSGACSDRHRGATRNIAWPCDTAWLASALYDSYRVSLLEIVGCNSSTTIPSWPTGPLVVRERNVDQLLLTCSPIYTNPPSCWPFYGCLLTCCIQDFLVYLVGQEAQKTILASYSREQLRLRNWLIRIPLLDAATAEERRWE